MQPFFTLYAYRDPFSSGKQVHSLIKYTVFPILLSAKKKNQNSRYCSGFGPSVEIRTRGLLNPIQARYQTSPHPDFACVSLTLEYDSTC